MPRRYSREINPMPKVDFPDWQLIERVGEVFAPYAGEFGRVDFTAKDSRGTYEEADSAAFKAEVERQDEPPQRISISIVGEDLMFNFAYSADFGYAEFRGDDEAAVVHAMDRCLHLVGQAHERREARLTAEQVAEEERRQQAAIAEAPAQNSPGPIPLAPVRSNRPRPFLRDVSVHVVGAVAAVAVVALAAILWAVLH